MSGTSHINLDEPCNLIHLYDGTLDGFFCCVYECVYSGQLPFDIVPEEEAQPSLMAQQFIATDPEKAKRVRQSIPKKISSDALELIQTVYLSCLPQKEIAMLRFLILGYREGQRTLSMLGNPEVATLFNAQRHLLSEQHLLTGFIRFSDYDGVLAATITPKNFVLPFLRGHFIGRYPNEDFMIFDKTHHAALIYQNKKSQIVALENIDFPQVSEAEEKYRALWKRFYKTVAIEARENPRCRMTHMPKRYWENMLEVQDELLPPRLAEAITDYKAALPAAKRLGLPETG